MMHIIKIQNIILQIGELYTALPGYKENTEKTKQTVCVSMLEHFKNKQKKMLAWIPCVCSYHMFYI